MLRVRCRHSGISNLEVFGEVDTADTVYTALLCHQGGYEGGCKEGGGSGEAALGTQYVLFLVGRCIRAMFVRCYKCVKEIKYYSEERVSSR